MSELSPPHSPARRWLLRIAALEEQAQQAARVQAQFRIDLAAFAVEDHADALGSEAVNSLALGLGLSPRQMQNRLGDALAFSSHPRLAGLVMDGTWLIEHADAVLDGLRCAELTEAQQQQVLDLILSRNLARVPWQLKKAVQAAIAVLFPELLQEKADKAKQDRGVRLDANQLGETSLVATGPAHLVEAMMTVLDTMTWPPAPGDERSADQRRFDCLFALLTGQAHPSQWQVHVLTTLESLLGADDHPAETAGGQLLPAAVARELATEGTLRRVVVDEHGRLVAVESKTDQVTPIVEPRTDHPVVRPQFDEDADIEADPGAPSAEDLAWFEEQQARVRWEELLPVPAAVPVVELPQPRAVPDVPSDGLEKALGRLVARPFLPQELSTTSYRPTRQLRRHLALRDRRCRFPGCPNRVCDLDHVIPAPQGPTNAANLASECEKHHRAKHQYFQVRVLPDGTLRWTDRGGRHFDSPVPTVLITAEFHHARIGGRGDPPDNGP